MIVIVLDAKNQIGKRFALGKNKPKRTLGGENSPCNLLVLGLWMTFDIANLVTMFL